MKTCPRSIALLSALYLGCVHAGAIDHFVSLTGGHIPPFTNWANAATNIQAAIDAASAGDIVWVTNGIYNSGGKVKSGDLTNRVALDKALTVQSVNGPAATFIQGQWDPAIPTGFGSFRGPGPAAVRCAWLTNGATLKGFTLRGGATRSSGDVDGGGIFCSSTTALVANCNIVNNAAAARGGGAIGGSLRNCAVTGNSAGSFGGGSASCVLKNCTLTANIALGGAGGSYSDLLTNCIVYFNTMISLPQDFPNYASSTLRYSCSTPLPTGPGNISSSPQLLADRIHLAPGSPCRGAGNATSTSGTDIDGQNWATPPSMGCDEWQPEPAIASQPKPKPATVTGQAKIAALIPGQQPISCFWSKDGLPLEDDLRYGDSHSPNLRLKTFGSADAGLYQVVASNSFGMVTSQVIQVLIHCVNSAGSTPVSPFSTWENAANTIQDAIEVAADADVVLVTNGTYSAGGKVFFGDLTNRVVVDRGILVTSVNGADATTIQGQWDPVGKIGSSAIRCVSLVEGAGLAGFTLLNGATRNSGWDATLNGGGVWCASTNVELANCVITNCRAYQGGGAYFGFLNNCVVVSNSAIVFYGGGVHSSLLNNCKLTGNTSGQFGGGAYFSQLFNSSLTGNTASSGGGSYLCGLYNCTVTANSAGNVGGGSAFDKLTNCIVFFNNAASSENIYVGIGSSAFTCSSPLVAGLGNISSDPQLSDGFHLMATSSCRGFGSSLYTTGTDLDGDTWLNPPSMGCDEVLESVLVGPLAVVIEAPQTNVLVNHSLRLTGRITGRASRLEWSFGDGPAITNLSYITSHAWTNAGDYTVTFTAFNTDNPAGVSTNLLIHVLPLDMPALVINAVSGTNFQIQFSSQNGASNFLEYTTNLNPPITWLTLKSLISTGGVAQITDTAATNAARFYRVRVQ